MERAHSQFAPPQAHADIDLPLFDLSISEGETDINKTHAAIAPAAAAAPSSLAPASASATSRHHSSSVFPSMSSLPACCAHSTHSDLWQQQQQLQQQQKASQHQSSAPAFGFVDSSESDDCDVYGTRLQLSQLVDLVFSNPVELLERAELEMEMLHQISASPASVARLYSEAATQPSLMRKNRYSNIIPTRAARVILPSTSSDPADSYINACLLAPLLPGCAQSYIAAQAPLPHTMEDFWRCVWAQRCRLVVMLTRERERDSSGRVAHKAHAYWPEHAGATHAVAPTAAAAASSGSGGHGSDALPSTRFGSFTVTLLSTRHEPDFVVRELLLTRDGEESTPRRVHQIQYTGWPDFGVPDDQDENGGFMRIFSVYRNLRAQLHDEHAAEAAAAAADALQRAEGSSESSDPSPSSSPSPLPSPVVVHCSAGIGRSGVWIAIDALLDALSCARAVNGPPASVDLFALVCRMREARQGMLQTKEQYAYVLHFIATCMQKRKFGVAVSE